jgi:hypothetical protein
LLRKDEFLKEPKPFLFVDIAKNKKQIQLKKGSLAFTYCQIPVIYTLSHKNGLKVFFKNGTVQDLQGVHLDVNTSSKIFKRTGDIVQIEVNLVKEA